MLTLTMESIIETTHGWYRWAFGLIGQYVPSVIATFRQEGWHECVVLFFIRILFCCLSVRVICGTLNCHYWPSHTAVMDYLYFKSTCSTCWYNVQENNRQNITLQSMVTALEIYYYLFRRSLLHSILVFGHQRGSGHRGDGRGPWFNLRPAGRPLASP